MSYIKDFKSWLKRKIAVDATDDTEIPYFGEREIWYCCIGHNIGYEQDGKGDEFWRPVVIIKKYNKHLFTGIPLTSKIKDFPFYHAVGQVDGKNAMAILSQTKSFSSKRLINKLETMDQKTFEELKKAASDYIFGD